MSHTIALDILQYETFLIDAGIPAKEAKAHAHATAMLIDNNIATKHDLKIGLKELELKIELVRKDIKWINIGGGFLSTLIVALLIFVITHLH